MLQQLQIRTAGWLYSVLKTFGPPPIPLVVDVFARTALILPPAQHLRPVAQVVAPIIAEHSGKVSEVTLPVPPTRLIRAGSDQVIDAVVVELKSVVPQQGLTAMLR